MMSRGDGEATRQEPKKRKSKSKGKQKSGGGGFAGWRKPTSAALAKVDHGVLRDLKQWSTRKTFKHQFRVAAARSPALPTQAPPSSPATFKRVHVSKSPPPGLAAVKYAQQQRDARGAALAELALRQRSGPVRRGSGPSSLGELYAYYKRNGMIEVFFSLFPG